MKLYNIYYTYKMNIKTNLLEEYVNFVDLTKKQNKYFKMFIILFVLILCLFFFVLFNNLNEWFLVTTNKKSNNLDANLISRKYILNLMADFMRVKYENSKMKQSEIATLMGLSSCTLQRFRNDVNMLSPYRINPNNTNKRTKKNLNTKFDNNSHRDPDLKRPQKTSNDLKTTSNEPGTKKKLKGGANIEFNDDYLDEILHNNNS